MTEKKVSVLPVGDGISSTRGGWSFSGDVANSFVPHVRRSVPFYDEGHDLVCKLSDFFVRPGSVAYEIGVSTGELIAKLSEFNCNKANVSWIGIDVIPEMIEEAKNHCSSLPNVSLVHDDITSAIFEPCDLIVSYYCVQFIQPAKRQALIDKIYRSLNWGGAFLLFEKVRAPDARFQDMSTALYNDFKTAQGFTDDEIMSKSRSLRGVLEPFSSQANVDLLKRAGFVDIWPVMKYVCFEGFLAIK